jgi:aconitate hydratase
MGVVPLQFPAGQTAHSLGLDGTEVFSVEGITELNTGATPSTVRVAAQPSAHSASGKATVSFDAVVRIDTPAEADYYRNGGILQYVLRSLL